MQPRSVASLTDFFDHVEAPDRSLVVLNQSGPESMVRMLEEGFAAQAVGVSEAPDPEQFAAAVEEVDEDVVALVEDGEVVQTSPLSALTESYLLVNSDLYRTGTVGLEELDPPAVLTELDETVFSLRGFPASNKEKLLLILISRYIERLAWRTDEGVHRASFQRLSRIEDERGTRKVYEKLGESGADVHVYGVPDDTPSDEWDGMWTYRPSLVADIEAYIRREL